VRSGARIAAVVATTVGILVITGGARSELDRILPPRAEPEGSPERLVRAFSDDSWWSTPLPDDAPTDPAGRKILGYLRTGPDSGDGCLKLAGVGDSHWGQPMYFAHPSDTEYDVRAKHYELPPELRALRIPDAARPAANNDSTMTIYDVDKGYVVALTGADYDGRRDLWSASGATVTYLASNGLHDKTGLSDDPRNQGTHRGNNGATMAVSWDQVQAGELDHVLKIASGPEVSHRYIFPMVGSDGHGPGDDPAVPPEGIRLRLKASLDLDDLDLEPEALVIAETLQRYGAYIGDSGGTTALKVENTFSEGRGRLWLVQRDALCGLPFDPRYWEVVAEHYDPTGQSYRRGVGGHPAPNIAK
jgi:hypothetical protein